MSNEEAQTNAAGGQSVLTDGLGGGYTVPLTLVGSLQALHVHCQKHGTHMHTITSNIKGHEGTWCQICWIDSLGPSLPSEMLPYSFDGTGALSGPAAPKVVLEETATPNCEVSGLSAAGREGRARP